MMDDRDIQRHLESGGEQVWQRTDPPALDLDAIVRDDARQPARRPRRTVRLRPLVLAGGAAGCVAAGLLGGALLFGGTTAPAPRTTTADGALSPLPERVRQVSLARFGSSAPPSAAAQASVFTATDGRTVDLRASGLDVPPKGQFYELWVLGDAGRMVSLGLLPVNPAGTVHVRVPLPVSLHRFPIFDISLESGDGNPTHSGHSVLRSAAAA
ncbi:MAG: anti-sigma factor [Solirubrobacteraceae bacterium]|nr:anti-sigma factor [Solirubrobacteraceae bacterium]